jgi:predicted transcriptional regulator YdeE
VSFEFRQERGLTVLGIYARASNAAPEKIGDLWRRFHAMGSAGAIDARQDDAVYSVYCEYEGDFTGVYTVVIGCAVDANAAIPDGMKKIEIDAGRFAVFEPVGELPKSVWEAWAEVWKTPFDRRYQADFDRYGSDGIVTVHVGVR